MDWKTIACAGALIAVAVVPAAAQSTLYEGARLIPGDGSPAIEQGALFVDKGVIAQIGRAIEIKVPAGTRRVSLAGKTVMPALVATHVHPGFQRGATYVASNFTRETVMNDLDRALYFGVGYSQSLGIETGSLLYDVRKERPTLLIAGRGIGSPNAGPGGATYAGMAYEVTTEAESRKAVEELAARKVDIVKIWVDDRNGRAPKLSPPLYRAIIDEAHARGLRVSAHVFYHDDAVDLVNAGVDSFAHLVRDRVMDDSLVAAIVKGGVYVMGNLSFPRRAAYSSMPRWLSPGDPLQQLLAESVSVPVLDRMRAYFSSRDAKAAAAARQRYDILAASMAKLGRAGARIILGADTGLEDHLFGMAEQLELQAMVEAGLTPAQAITSSTSRAAEFLRLGHTGTLRRGLDADFLVLDGNPLDDITHAARIVSQVIKGAEVDRRALRARIQ
jgi:imidazolonepropionase-like amidohydrolase